MEGMRVLVTGGAGFIGSALVRALVNAGASVRVVDDFSTGSRERLQGLPPRVEVLQADVRNPAVMARAIHGAGHVVHLAGPDGDTDVSRAQEVVLGGTVNLLEAVRHVDRTVRPRIVVAGSGAVYGAQASYVLHEEVSCRPVTPEGVMAQAVEGWVRLYRESWGVPATVLRLFPTFGPDEEPEREGASLIARLVRAALDGSSPQLPGDGAQTRDFVYVDNVVQALQAALVAEPTEPINIASGEAVTLNFLWSLVLEVAGKRRLAIEPTYVGAPPWDQKNVRPQIARACKVLRWAPSVRLREGVQRVVQHQHLLRHADPNAWFAPPGSLVESEPQRPLVPIAAPPRPPEPSARERWARATPPQGVPTVRHLQVPPPPPRAGGSGPKRLPPRAPTPPFGVPAQRPVSVYTLAEEERRRTSAVAPLPQLDDTPVEIDDAAVLEERPAAARRLEEEDDDLVFEWAPVPSMPGVR